MKRLIVSRLLASVIAVISPFTLVLAQQQDSGIVRSPVPEVTDVVNLASGHENELRVGDRISVKVKYLTELVAQQQSDTSRLILYIDNVPMTDIRASSCNLNEGFVFFELDRGNGTDPWDVFYQPCVSWKKNVAVSVGYYNTGAVHSNVKSELVIIRKGYFCGAVFLVIGLFILLVYAIKRGLLKDDSILPLAEKPYSLSRSQFTFWTFIIAVSYVFIALVTGGLAPLTTSTLILLGISGVTTAAASTIDTNDKLNNTSRQQDNYSSAGFLNDILSDAHGVSVHRFQMLVFNIILGIFFFKQVFLTLQMPDFDNNLLTLMGLSNIAYAGLKINENKGAAIVNPQVTDAAGTEDVPPVG